MKRAIMLAAALAIGLSGFGPMSQAEDGGSAGDEDVIRKIVAVMTDEFNRHNAKAATQMYDPDARFVTVRGEVMNGQPAIEKGLASILGTRAKSASITPRAQPTGVRQAIRQVERCRLSKHLGSAVQHSLIIARPDHDSAG